MTMEIPFRADPAHRPPPPGARSPLEPGRRVALFAATLLYGLLFAGLTADLRLAPKPAPARQEIPIEIVPEPEPTPAPKAQDPPTPIMLPEAHDAPREGTADHDTEIVGKSEKAPLAPEPTPEQKSDTPQDNSKPAEAAADPQPKPPDAQTPSPDAPAAPVADGATPPPKVAKADPKPAARAPAKFSLPATAFESVPDVDFGAAAMKALISGGRGRGAYTNVLLGLIVRHVRIPQGTAKGAPGVISFVVDAKGRLADRRVTRSSGLPELDAEVFEAIGKASPFPPPPGGVPAPLEFTFNNN